MGITREKYNEALDVVEQFHKQLFNIPVIEDNNKLKIGDVIIFTKIHPSSKNITLEKPYTIRKIRYWDDDERGWMSFYQDNGKMKSTKTETNGWRWHKL